MSLANKYGYDDEIASLHFRWGKLTSDLGKWEESKRHLESVIEWYEKYQDEAEQDILFLMGARGHLGWVEFHLENYQRAKELIENSLTVFEHMGGKGHTAKLHRQLASIEISLGNRENARMHLHEALFWAERLGIKQEIKQVKTIIEELEK